MDALIHRAVDHLKAARQAAALTGPPAIDGIGPTGRWEDYYKEADAARRNCAPWAAKAA